MRKIIIILLTFTLVGIIANSFSSDKNMNQQLSDESKLLYNFIDREGKNLGKKYHMRHSSTGIGGMDKVWIMSLGFQRYGYPLTEEDARRLIVNCVNDFIDEVNRDEPIRPLLRDFPFTAKNVEIVIHNYDKDGYEMVYPLIGTVRNSEGKIGYLIDDELIKNEYKSKKYETYDEAVAILQKEEKKKSPQ